MEYHILYEILYFCRISSSLWVIIFSMGYGITMGNRIGYIFYGISYFYRIWCDISYSLCDIVFLWDIFVTILSLGYGISIAYRMVFIFSNGYGISMGYRSSLHIFYGISNSSGISHGSWVITFSMGYSISMEYRTSMRHRMGYHILYGIWYFYGI